MLAFELKLLGVLGLAPDLAQARLSPGAKGLLKALAEEDWPAIALLKATAAQASELREFLKQFLVFNLPAVPRSRDSALQPARPGIAATGSC